MLLGYNDKYNYKMYEPVEKKVHNFIDVEFKEDHCDNWEEVEENEKHAQWKEGDVREGELDLLVMNPNIGHHNDFWKLWSYST